MLIDRYESEDVFARVPELADQTDPVLVQLDHLPGRRPPLRPGPRRPSPALPPNAGPRAALDAGRGPDALTRRAALVCLEL